MIVVVGRNADVFRAGGSVRAEARGDDARVNVVERQKLGVRADRAYPRGRRLLARRGAELGQAARLHQSVHQMLHGVGQQVLLVVHRDRVVDHHQEVELVRHLVAHQLHLLGRRHRRRATTTARARVARVATASVPARAAAALVAARRRARQAIAAGAAGGTHARAAGAGSGTAGAPRAPIGAGRRFAVVPRISTRHGEGERKQAEPTDPLHPCHAANDNTPPSGQRAICGAVREQGPPRPRAG